MRGARTLRRRSHRVHRIDSARANQGLAQAHPAATFTNGLRDGLAFHGDERGFETFGRGVLGKKAFERLSPERRKQSWENRATDKAQLLGEGFPPLGDDEVRSILKPVLLMHGRESPALFHVLADRLEDLLPNVERLEIPHASHIVHEDNPRAVNEAILMFLKRLTSAKR
jgi:pimeloyl-ACP methyl ester carboxylesterase